MVINGKPAAADQARVVRDGKRTVVTLALPIAEAGNPINERLWCWHREMRLLYALPCQLKAQAGTTLGFGKNRLVVEFSGPATFAPIDVELQSLAQTRTGLVTRSLLTKKALTGPATFPLEFQVASEGPVAICAVVRSVCGQARTFPLAWWFVHPVRESLRRAEQVSGYLNIPQDTAAADLAAKAAAMERDEAQSGPKTAARLDLYRQARWLARQAAMANPRMDFDKLLFVKRFTQETYNDVNLNHLPWVSRPGGDICVLSPVAPDGQVTNLLHGALGPGHVHGMDLWYDARSVVFGYARSASAEPPPGWLDRSNTYEIRKKHEATHLYEIGADGRGLRQLTGGVWSDLDPTYLPSGEIAFVSERCGASLQCNEYDKDETSCNLYVMKSGGEGIRRLSASKDGDYLPHTFDDGTIGYTRWEYQERGWANIQSIWYIRPDGTGADALYKQHMNDPWALEDTRSIPGTDKYISIACGHHTIAEGPLVVIDPSGGINNPHGINIVTPDIRSLEGGMSGSPAPEGGTADGGGTYMTPWPLSDKCFLASYCYGEDNHASGFALYLVDVFGTKELLYRDPAISCSTPVPLVPRSKPPVLIDATNPLKNYATCVVGNVGVGSEQIAGKVKYIRIAQGVGWPYDHKHGGFRYEPDAKAGPNWTPTRILGTVPVEADGSAYFVVPADQAVFFQLLDENQMDLRRMRSFISFQRGENRSCVGCHETRAVIPPSPAIPMALHRKPSVPVPPPWGSERPVSFLADVQPVLDRNCVRCHSGLSPAGGLDFFSGLTAAQNRAYDTISEKGLVARSYFNDDAKITQPLAFGSHQSKLISVLSTTHAQRVKLSEDDRVRLVTWVDANAPYHHSFIDKRPDKPPYDLPADASLLAAVTNVNTRRCAACHKPQDVSRLDWIDVRNPEASLFLCDPLIGKSAKCKGAYKDANDADYQALLKTVRAAVAKAWENPRRDVMALKK